MKASHFLAGVSAFLLPLLSAADGRSFEDHTVEMGKELLITAPEVVDSPLATYPGPWSFGHLMEEAFGKELAPGVVARWLEDWSAGVPADGGGNGGIPAREGVRSRIIEPWQRADGYRTGATTWMPRWENAPFRLLAIVNRMDLGEFDDEEDTGAGNFSPWAGGSDGPDKEMGEGRLVFCAVDPSGKPMPGGFTLIFEYGLAGNGDHSRLDWALAWHSLGTRAGFDADYLGYLADLTRVFTDRRNMKLVNDKDVARPIERLPRSEVTQLMRVRVNDGALGAIREFREFHPEEGFLKPAVLAGTPAGIYFKKGSKPNRMLANWLDHSVATIRNASEPEQRVMPDAFELPAQFSSGGERWPVSTLVSPVEENDPDFHWDGWGLRVDGARRVLSMQTCCGCHCGDTKTRFFHIEPRETGEAALLSKFLRTDGSRYRLRDPGSGDGVLSSEMENRLKLFRSFLSPDLRVNEIRQLQISRRLRIH